MPSTVRHRVQDYMSEMVHAGPDEAAAAQTAPHAASREVARPHNAEQELCSGIDVSSTANVPLKYESGAMRLRMGAAGAPSSLPLAVVSC